MQIPESFFTEPLTEDTIRPTLTDLMGKIPAWLRYTRDSQLREDVQRYLLHAGDLLDRRRLVRT